MTEHATQRRRFSIVVAVHDVSAYLDEFFASLEAQSYGADNVDIVLVDDGSTDDSLAKCEAFAAKRPTTVRVLHQEHGGLSSARNLGIEQAQGEWVTFVDADDMLDARYFDAVTDFVKNNPDPELAMLHTAAVVYHEKTGNKAQNSPLLFKFASGNRIADLRIEPENIQTSASTGFFRMDLIRQLGLRFDERVRPTFEGAHFVARYLVASEVPKVALIRSARYYFRNRANKSSVTNTSFADLGKYTDVPKYGYIGALEHANTVLGHIPLWLQYTVLYDIAQLFRADVAVHSATGSISPEVLATFHELVRSTLSYMSPGAVASFSGAPVSDDIRFALVKGYAESPEPATSFRLEDYDHNRGLVLLKYRFVGEQPHEAVYVDSRIVQPAHTKTRTIEFFGRTLARERHIWVPLGKQVRLFLDGTAASLASDVPRTDPRVRSREVQQAHRDALDANPERFRKPTETLPFRARRLVRREFNREALRTKGIALLLHSWPVRRAFRDAWVFMDRDTGAGDNGEAFYKYISAEHPEINAWFVITRDSSDWKRLRREGVRTIAYGSLRWTLLMLSAIHLVSSHADTKVLTALDAKRFGAPRWLFTFLQHGVIKDDLSRWLNTKRIDMFVTTTPAEYASIAGDETHYDFSSKEVVLTGLPRHDQLIAKRDAVPAAERNLLLVMPTWRRDIVGTATTSSNKLIENEEFSSSEYAQRYSALLCSESLSALARQHGSEIVFMPHPMMAPYLKDFAVPAGVRVLGYSDIDVQQVLARAALLITDYSSLAFDTAVLGVPTIYYQYDRAEIYSGSHNYRAGYFDYDTDGFGPVCDTLDEVEIAAGELLPIDGAAREVYVERITRTFAFHDANSSARVYQAMLVMSGVDSAPASTPGSTEQQQAAGAALDQSVQAGSASQPA